MLEITAALFATAWALQLTAWVIERKRTARAVARAGMFRQLLADADKTVADLRSKLRPFQRVQDAKGRFVKREG